MQSRILNRTARFTVLELISDKPGEIEKIRIVSGETLKRTDHSLMLRMTYNDCIVEKNTYYLLWDQDHCKFTFF